MLSLKSTNVIAKLNLIRNDYSLQAPRYRELFFMII